MNEELELYAQEVRRRIIEQDGEVFRNRSGEHAAIILREFVESARASIRIFCGHLDKKVYGNLLPYFLRAMRRGVDVQVITAERQIDAQDLAQGLRSENAIRSLNDEGLDSPFRLLPHFSVIDGRRYRLETNAKEKAALVCAYTQSESQKARAELLEGVFDQLWDSHLVEA